MQNKNKKEIRYELECEGAVAKLAPLSFHVAEAALGFTFRQFPKKISAGEVIFNSLYISGSPKFKAVDKNSSFFSRVCMEAYKIIELLEYTVTEDDFIVVKNHKGKEFKCRLKKDIDREVLENALGLIQPSVGNAMPLSAGKLILENCWIDGESDEEIKKDDELLIPVCLAAYYRIERKEASLKKL